MSGTKPVVAVAMSGGVDSSVTAALLVDKGYQVMGIMMRLWDADPDQEAAKLRRLEMEERAARAAEKVGIPFEIVGMSTVFRKKVVDYFISSQMNGSTPNPCFVCNQHIKWGALWEESSKRGAEYLATGHYARVLTIESGKFELFMGVDQQKDQSYVLAGLTQQQLSRAILPLGDIMKTQVREIAHRYNFGITPEQESQDLCFLGGVTQERFLQSYAPESNVGGLIKDSQGRVIGRHSGLSGYTIGQRKGLGSGFPEPMYVLEKNPQNNEIFIGPRSELGSKRIVLGDLNWISGVAPSVPCNFSVKVRYKAKPIAGMLKTNQYGEFEIEFDQLVRDATPGQFAVLYEGEKVIGSGVIKDFVREVP